MKRIISAILVCICIFSLLACSKYDESYVYDGHSLLGKWCDKDYDESGYESYEFLEDNTVILTQYHYGIAFKEVKGTYAVENNKIVIDVVEYNNSVIHYEHKFSMTDKGELVIIYLSEKDQMTEEEMVLVPFESYNEGNAELYGKWEDTSNRGEYWQFNEDFTGSIYNQENSYKMHFSVHGRKLYMAYEFVDGVKQNLVEFDYKIKGDTLTLKCKIDGEKLEYSFERK